jgi:hypothetical protein
MLQSYTSWWWEVSWDPDDEFTTGDSKNWVLIGHISSGEKSLSHWLLTLFNSAYISKEFVRSQNETLLKQWTQDATEKVNNTSSKLTMLFMIVETMHSQVWLSVSSISERDFGAFELSSGDP